MKIKVEINELVLHGFSYHDHMRVGTAVEKELAKLIGRNGLPEAFTPAGSSHISSLDAGSFDLKNENPNHIGVEIARSLFKAWNLSKAINR